MDNTKQFFGETAKTAAFAVREFFRPLFAIPRFMIHCLASDASKKPVSIPVIQELNQKNAVRFEDAKVIQKP
jgi:hypothetical protein